MAKGVELHGNQLRVYFRYQGGKRREPLNLPDTAENRAYAERLVAMVEHEIRAGTLDYGRYFPNSKHLKESTFGHFMDLWLQIKGREVADSTFRSYRVYCEHRIRPAWGHRQADQIDHVAVQQWIGSDLLELSNKSIKEIVAIMRQIYRLYRARNRSFHDPTEGISIRLKDQEEPDPFSREEIGRILATATGKVQELNLIQYMLWSGPRVSEAIALAWEDVDLEAGLVKIRRAKVDKGSYRVTKTRGSTRTQELLDEARQALKRQYLITGKLPPREVEVKQRDNRSVKTEKLRFVFLKTGTDEPVQGDKYLRDYFFAGHLKAAGVRYRGPGQCRHTFASQMLTIDMPISWIISQTGHTSEATFRKNYARWIRKDSPVDMVELARQRLKR